MVAEVKDITEVQFEAEVTKAAGPILVDFWAPWCGPCKAIAPTLKELAEENQDRFKVVKVNVDENPDLASRFNVMGIPTMVLFKGGQVVDRFTGAMSKQALADKISKHI